MSNKQKKNMNHKMGTNKNTHFRLNSNEYIKTISEKLQIIHYINFEVTNIKKCRHKRYSAALQKMNA